jgi:drug/metabolite transporter (DMT)-like permease
MLMTEERKGALSVLGTGVLWGSIGVFVAELAARGSTPALTGFMRMAFGFLIVLPAAALRRSLWVDRRTLLSCALLGLLAHAPFNVFYGLSVPANGVALAAVLLYTAPVFTALASAILFGERFTLRKLLALAVNIAGCILAVTGGDFSGSGSGATVAGVLFGLGAGFFYGMVPILGKVAGQRADPFTVSTWSYFFTAIALLAFTKPPVALLANAGISGLGFFYGMITAALPYLLYYFGVQRIRDTSRVPVFASIELVIAAVIGVAFYSEPLGWVNIAGVVMVLASIALDSR